ncbi:MAG: AmmeMemoRadiSam system radical SAM enzyme [Proteobacteria bacterium]|nr:AmmeMemoRadiSam system radical SAM enzyme [Pseudomonadota bacterium]MBU1737671.1 AmmeMemoRadiSam system radical SAM enzyme [Pseudomonadota bacterium]
MHEALFYQTPDENSRTVRCRLCAHNCLIKEGRRGICNVRGNENGVLYSLVYGRLVSENIDPIEKKPLFHLLPGSLSYSIATVGCNFRCQHCQNYEISQFTKIHGGDVAGRARTPEEVVTQARATGCASISYTYVEPTIFYEFAFDTAMLAHEQGLKNIFVSNGYTGPEATKQLAPYLDANNIDLKAFSDKFYKEVCGARLQPVLDTIVLMKELGVWVEITTLLIPGWNDSDEELQQIAGFIKSVSPDIPWHVTRFHPTFKMTDRPATPVETVRKARDIGLAEGLRHVYVGNIPGESGENTNCTSCGKTLITRHGFNTNAGGMHENSCASCGTLLPGIFS